MKTKSAYIKAKRAFLAGKKCAVFPFLEAREVHHVNGRLGPLLTDQSHWLAVSSIGHCWIHRNIEEARVKGWLAPLGQWNRTPRTHHD